MKQLIGLIIIGTLLVSACANPAPGPRGEDSPHQQKESGLAGASQELQTFGSIEELRDYLEEHQGASYANYATRGGAFAMETMMDSAVAAPMAASKSASGGADEYSQTNVQVAGVDEADFVKNDGEYIYMVSGDELLIVDAYPAEEADIVSETDLDGRAQNLFVNDDQAVVFVSTNEYVYAMPMFEIMPRPQYTSMLKVLIFDISDRASPELEEEYLLNGNYLESRMIGDVVYFIANENVRMWDHYPDVPMIKSGGEIIVEPPIHYFDNPEENYQFTTVATIDLATRDVEAESYLMGYASTLYMSEEALFIAYQKNLPRRLYEEEKEEKFWEAVVPALPSDIRRQVRAVRDDGLEPAEEWLEIKELLGHYYESLDEEELEELMEEVSNAVREWEWEREEDRQRTVIHRFDVDATEVEHVARGEVKGRLLNQFSLDEYQGDLRVATTTNVWSREGSNSWNNVYVLDEEMDVVGELEGLAEGESIYSTRFMGERLYMVTFERIDPLFVIDLSEPSNPSVLGELKIPGYSDYLHPMGDDYLIGIGQETKENQWGGVSTNGIKMALFDVSDVTDPKEVDVVRIGGPGSSTEVSHEHKAFLFSDERDLLVLPVRVIEEEWEWNERWRYRENRVWQGAYAYTLTEEGFEERGRIRHFAGDENAGWYWGSPSAVRRSLYLDDVLYTISQRKIEMHDIETIDQLGSVSLPYSEPVYRGGAIEPMPMVDMIE